MVRMTSTMPGSIASNNLHPINKSSIRTFWLVNKQELRHLVVKQDRARTKLFPFVQLLAWIVLDTIG